MRFRFGEKDVLKSALVAALASGIVLTVGGASVRDCWDVSGSFGIPDGEVVETAKGYSFETSDYRLETQVEKDGGGVELRRSVLANVSGGGLSVRCLLDRFVFDGDDYEVYTQANTWQGESRGRWQPLHLGVEARGDGMRTSFGAAPMMAVWNRQTARGRVFHLLTDSSWEMHARRMPAKDEKTKIVVEVGVDSRHLDHVLGFGESVAFPEILTYEFSNRIDLDCHKLHAWWNGHYPKKSIPAVYNSWLCRYDKIDADLLLRQVDCAKRLGLDYFVLDAGWFGKKADWWTTRGDWEECPDGALSGRVGEISSAVRSAGMKFGLWLELEAASKESKTLKANPDWYVRRGDEFFLDFRNPAAFDNMLEVVCALVRRYGVSFLKLDFNQDGGYDTTGRAFSEYNAGYRRLIRAIRERNPGIYIEGCASGGLMMDLGWARDYDSFWLSDNQSPVHGLRIVKETMLRMPPQMIERWVVAYSDHGVQPDYFGNVDRVLVPEDGLWSNIRSVGLDLLEAFTLSGPIGLSCDLTAFSEKDLARLADIIRERKRDDAFWCSAVGRILCDTSSLSVFQYSDADLADVRIVVLPDRMRQERATVFPVLNPAESYRMDGKVRAATDIATSGISVVDKRGAPQILRLERVRR